MPNIYQLKDQNNNTIYPLTCIEAISDNGRPISFDEKPIKNSTNLIKSGGVYKGMEGMGETLSHNIGYWENTEEVIPNTKYSNKIDVSFSSGNTILIELSGTTTGNFVLYDDSNTAILTGSTGHTYNVTLPNNTSSLTFIRYNVPETYVGVLKFIIRYGGIQDYLFTTTASQMRALSGYVNSEVTELTNTVNTVAEDIDYFIPTSGVYFGDTYGDLAFKNGLIQIWLEVLDPTVELPENLYLYRFMNTDEEYIESRKCMVDIRTSTDDAFFYLYKEQKQTGVQTYQIQTSSVAFRVSPFLLNITIDWDKVGDVIAVPWAPYTRPETMFKTEELNVGEFKPLKDAIFDLEKPINGKTIVCIGDSITEIKDSISSKTYANYLTEICGANTINIGIGATHIAERSDPKIDPETLAPSVSGKAYAALDVVNIVRAVCGVDYSANETYFDLVRTSINYLRDKGDDNTSQLEIMESIDWQNVDAVIIMGGTNDFNSSVQLGNANSTNAREVCGAINIIIQTLLSKYKHLKLFWATPTVRWFEYSGSASSLSNYSNYYKKNTLTLKDYSESIFNAVKNNQIPVVDLYNDLGWTQWNFSQYFNDNDGTHPRKGLRDIAVAINSLIQKTYIG